MSNSATVRKQTTVGLVSLGCAKNLVDSEIMLGSLIADGMILTNDPAKADALIINTCSFIDAAQEESVEQILESATYRDSKHRHQALIVAGCLSQRFREELPKLLPEVDAFMGIDQVAQAGSLVRLAIAQRSTRTPSLAPATKKESVTARLAKLDAGSNHAKHDSTENLRGTPRFNKTKTVATKSPALFDVTRRPAYIPDHTTPRFRLTPSHYAYVKIAEGCNHPCSFCTIPQMRGSHRSRPMDDIVAEAKRLISEGVRELNLISQDSTYYGMDLRQEHSRAISSPERFNAAAATLTADAPSLPNLLRALNSLRGDFWIRLLYTHPAHWTDTLIETIARCPKVARYVDMPLQHIHDNMLERMRRETDSRHITDVIRRIRAGIPGITVRTTFIVGFPGETESAFESLMEFIRQTRFDRLGIFKYSKEEGTRAGNMAGQISESVKRKRHARAMAEQRKIASELNAAKVGQKRFVLVEREATEKDLTGAQIHSWEHGFIRTSSPTTPMPSGRYFQARSDADAPDIDGRVYVRGRAPVGDFCWVKIVGQTDYDLIAEPI